MSGPGTSLRELLERFSDAGADLRDLAQASGNVWKHLSRPTLVSEISDRLRDPMVMDQAATGLCGPISIASSLARRDKRRYIAFARELLETGKFTCPGGRTIVAEQELRDEPLITSIPQIDWLFAATMRDDDNLADDVDDDAFGIESMTFWETQADWAGDVLSLNSDFRTCFASDDEAIQCMRDAQDAVNSGGVAYFLIDANMIKDGGDDDEEWCFWERGPHAGLIAPVTFGPVTHAKDDNFPPDHWVEYLGGLAIGSDPDEDQKITFRLWSWAREYIVQTTIDAFTEYLYAVSFAKP